MVQRKGEDPLPMELPSRLPTKFTIFFRDGVRIVVAGSTIEQAIINAELASNIGLKNLVKNIAWWSPGNDERLQQLTYSQRHGWTPLDRKKLIKQHDNSDPAGHPKLEQSNDKG
jgi:hypothetical protein